MARRQGSVVDRQPYARTSTADLLKHHREIHLKLHDVTEGSNEDAHDAEIRRYHADIIDMDKELKSRNIKPPSGYHTNGDEERRPDASE